MVYIIISIYWDSLLYALMNIYSQDLEEILLLGQSGCDGILLIVNLNL